ncbi:NADP-dependent isocitrate dehydrogenase [uncultured Winogradskyella sp.]|uniref:NADP-dependent isocitrate dehydrogenase n=1 Tax=uncultured Winogradskyella sp. TaxID=395353 RepID=UPI003515FF58
MTKITVAKGDGIGPEIMDATLRILEAAGAQLDIDEIEVGEKVYLAGNTAGISDEAWETIRRNKIFLKAPITTPQGGGYKSLNVTTRKTLGLFANVRPCKSLHPYIATKHPEMDVVIVRENEEDLYAGIEHQQTDEVVQCLKLISRPGCEKIITYAFEYAKKFGRKKVTCFTKDNIMKQTDGLFHKVFDEIAAKYPDIENEHWIVDIGAAKLADSPEVFDVIVMPNLYGDVLSDVAAQITGSVGLAGSSNIGHDHAMFEAIHGSAPRRAGQNMANPSGLIQGAILMLQHIGQSDIAAKVQNAWLKTMEDGIHTYDVYDEKVSTQKVGTKEFADAVISNLGQVPKHLKKVEFENTGAIEIPKHTRRPRAEKVLVGVDVFVDWEGTDPDVIGEKLQKMNTDVLHLTMITNRGVKVWPNGFDETFCTDHWRCRFSAKDGKAPTKADIIEVLTKAEENGIDAIKTENLYTFDGVRGYSLGQGQ